MVTLAGEENCARGQLYRLMVSWLRRTLLGARMRFFPRRMQCYSERRATHDASAETDTDDTHDTHDTQAATVTGRRLDATQIEKYKRQLYDLIAKRHDYAQATRMTQLLVATCEPSLHLLNVVLKAQLMMRNAEGVRETLLRIAANGHAFNAVTLNLLLVYYRDLGMMGEADRLFAAMEQRRHHPNPLINCSGPNLSAYTTMIAGWAREGDYARAKHYYRQIREEGGLVPDEYATSCLLSGAVLAGEFDDARMLYQSIATPNAVTQKTWLRACVRSGQPVATISAALDALLQRGDASLEMSELVRWVATETPEMATDMRAQIALLFLDGCMAADVRIGDRQCIHVIFDLVRDGGHDAMLRALAETCIRHADALLPVIAGRLASNRIARGDTETALRLRDKILPLRLGLPRGLLEALSALTLPSSSVT